MKRQHGAQEGEGDCDSSRAAHCAQQHALGEQLTNHTHRRGSQGGTDGHLAAASGSPRQQEVGNVGARNQEHATDAPHQHQQRRTNAAGECVIDGLQIDAEAGSAPGVLAMQPRGHCVELLLCLPESQVFRQADQAA